MRSERRRSDRPDKARGRPIPSVEALEGRQLLASAGFQYFQPTDLPIRTVDNQTATAAINNPQSVSDRQLTFLDADGKVLSGTDRQGDQWSITVHGPGSVIVTDDSPNDGVLDDELDTIQLVGTSLTDTYVTGQVVASGRLQTNGTIEFNHLVAQNGVASIILNGFTLDQSAPPGPDGTTSTQPAIYLPEGVQTLQFHDIDGIFDTSQALQPIQIIIGSAAQPLPSNIQPTIRLDSIFNTTFDSTAASISLAPQTTPTVQILVNGVIHGLDYISSTAAAPDPSLQFEHPTVNATGRTAVQAVAIDHLNVTGSATNTTFAKRSVPFQNGLSGLDHVGSATFGGNADAVGIDASGGRIGRLTFARGLGNPTGTNPSATAYGTPIANYGYPAVGLLGGLVTASHIGSIQAGAANANLQTSNNPDLIQLYVPNFTTYRARAGNSLTNAAIVSSGSIGNVGIDGNSQTTEISSGFHYPSFVAGLQPTRARSTIGPVAQHGDLIDSVVSATYRPLSRTFGLGANDAGSGTIRGTLQGQLVTNSGVTPLGNAGTGFFAKKKLGYLPPPSHPNRVDGVLTV